MRILKKILLGFLGLLLLPIIYAVVALILSNITVNTAQSNQQTKEIYLHSNGVHLDFAIDSNLLDKNLQQQLAKQGQSNYYSFGWGDENFYLNTPEWSDLTFSTATKALFLKSATLVHVTRFQNKQKNWTLVRVNKQQLQKLNAFLGKTFQQNAKQQIVHLPGESYGLNDDFYKANGSYHLFYTCNSWVNHAFKQADLKASYWTPFDFPLLDLYQK